MKWSTSPHRPPHLYIDDAWYFVTVSTVKKVRILSSDEHLNLWVSTFKGLIAEFKVKVTAWSCFQIIIISYFFLNEDTILEFL